MKQLLSPQASAVMGNSNFRLFLLFRFCLTMATLIQSVIIGWQIYSLTKNVLSLGIIGLMEVIPHIGIALFAGHFVDLWNRKKIIVYTSILLLAGSSILLIYSIPSLNCFALFGTLPIYVTVFLTGLVRGILMPAQTAMLGQLVPRELLTAAATWNSTTWQLAAVIGPAIGGLIYGFSGIVPAYSSAFILFLISILLIFQVVAPQTFVASVKKEGIFVRINQGIKYVFKSQYLLGAFSLDMFAVLFGGATAMLPVFASDILKVGPQGLGILRACPALGAIVMSFFLMIRFPMKNTGKFLFIAVTGFGLCMISFALSTNFWLSVLILILSGAFDNISVVIRASILQLYTPDDMRGRVGSVNSIFIGSSNELGAFESGLAARLMGLIPSVIFGGVMILLIVAFAAKVSPVLRNLSFHNKPD